MGILDLQKMEYLFFVLFGLILVILIALVVYVVVSNRRQRDRMFRAYEADRLAPRPARRVAGQVLSLVRDEVGGALQVEVDGVRYGRLTDIEDPQIRRQIVGAAVELIQLTGVLEQDAIKPIPADRTASWREDLRDRSATELERINTAPTSSTVEPEIPIAAEEIEERFLDLLTEIGQTPQSLERPTIIGSIQQRLKTRQAEPVGSRTFVDEIEDIVQRRLPLIPALVGRDLHVRLYSDGSVCFVFEGQEYESMDEVPNLTARQLIRDAIREWEETV
jgi:hypothetical protein